MRNQDELRPPAGSLRELLRIALPLILSSGSVSLMHVIDRVFLTWYSTDALAASMPAGMLLWTVVSLPMGIASYVNTFVAQYEGAGRKERVASAVWQGVYFSITAGLLLMLIAPFSGTIFRLVGHEPAVQRLEAVYFGVLCLGALPLILSSTLSSFFSGRGQTAVILWVNLGSVAVNAMLDYGLIFGAGPFPEWGIAGAAVATVSGYAVAVVLYAALLLRPAVARQYGLWANRGLDAALFQRMMRYGFPNGLLMFIDVTGFSVFIFLVGWLGSRELAATSLAFNLNSLAFIPMWGFGIAVATIVGQRIGEGRPELAVRTTWKAFVLGGGYMLAFAAVYVFLPDLILLPYAMFSRHGDDFAAIRETVVLLLRFVAFYSFFDAMSIIFGSAIRGAGDTRFSMVFILVAVWLTLVLPTYLAWVWFGGSLTVAWLSCALYAMVLGFGFLWRFQAGHWKSMQVIESPDEENEQPDDDESPEPLITSPLPLGES